MADMRAVQYDTYGSPDVLRVRRVPVPRLRPAYALVRVNASSVNAADVAIRSGRLKVLAGRSFPRGVGFDFAGEVAEAGDGAGVAAGDPVWGFLPGTRQGSTGAAADYVLAPTANLAPRPRDIDAVGAAALAGTGAAAIQALRDVARLRAGERVLVRGAAGGVGTAAVQVARAMGGRVTALVGTKHVDLVRELGAEQAYDYRATDPRDLGRFDVVLDPVGKNLRAYRRLLGPGGRMVALIFTPGQLPYLLLSTIFGGRRVRLLRSNPSHEVLRALAAYVAAKDVLPVVDRSYPLDDIAAAHRSVEAGGGFGKRVIRLD